MKKRVLSAMRPTGALHLGHLAGALSNFVRLQNDDNYECFYSIADWHALMSNYAESGRTSEFCYMALTDWLSVGLDPEKSPLFIQSHVKQHAELALALGMITPLGWLYRNPTYKEQLFNIRNKDLGMFGFLGYPVLMAADILLYKAEFVPVGEDQSAHLELSRELVRRFNNFFGDVLVEPQPLFTQTPKVPGIDGRKMSKSYGNALELSESADSMWQKLRTMKTDPARMRRTDKGDPEKCPVWDLHKVFNNDENEKNEICEGCKSAGIGCIDCKKKLNAHINELMTPIRERRSKYEGNKSLLDEILRDGALRAEKVAGSTMDEIYPAMGLLPRINK
ncbi:MAG: tryptophan--tRNA ligase [Synergistaceae bacterium]|nr:tryptophan--tRNA ligase [Synergistaceae bacterium]